MEREPVARPTRTRVRVAVWALVVVVAAVAVTLAVRGRAGSKDAGGAVDVEATQQPVASAAVDAESADAAAGWPEAAAPTGSEERITGSAQVGTSRLPKLLDLGAGTCVPCKMMAPILDEMKATFDGQLDVEFIDVRKDNAAARKYGIQVIPTQIFFAPGGKELFRHQGFFSREDMLAKWKELGYEFAG